MLHGILHWIHRIQWIQRKRKILGKPDPGFPTPGVKMMVVYTNTLKLQNWNPELCSVDALALHCYLHDIESDVPVRNEQGPWTIRNEQGPRTVRNEQGPRTVKK